MNYLMWALAVLAAVVLWLIVSYNSLISWRNRTEESWSDIDVQLKRRYDLIPNLVEAVKGYATHERELFERVTAARAAAMGAGNMADKAIKEDALSNTLKSLFAVSENYPELKASQNFLKLQDELSDTENKIQAARRFYNTNVRDYNTKLQVFPTNLIAGMLKFQAREFFQAGEGERQNVAVKF